MAPLLVILSAVGTFFLAGYLMEWLARLLIDRFPEWVTSGLFFIGCLLFMGVPVYVGYALGEPEAFKRAVSIHVFCAAVSAFFAICGIIKDYEVLVIGLMNCLLICLLLPAVQEARQPAPHSETTIVRDPTSTAHFTRPNPVHHQGGKRYGA